MIWKLLHEARINLFGNAFIGSLSKYPLATLEMWLMCYVLLWSSVQYRWYTISQLRKTFWWRSCELIRSPIKTVLVEFLCLLALKLRTNTINYDQQLIKCCKLTRLYKGLHFSASYIQSNVWLRCIYRKRLSKKQGTFKQKFGFDGDPGVICGRDITCKQPSYSWVLLKN